MRTWGTLLSADEARARFRAAWQPRDLGEEAVPTPSALGRLLARPISAPEDLPPFDRSLMDGFACRAEDLAAVPARLRLVGDVRMGLPAGCALGLGEAAAIPTGGMLPAGADVVAPVESADRDGDYVVVLQSLAAGRHLIRRGEDVTAGTLLLDAGHRIRAADIGALMSLGFLEVAVRRLPRVGLIATGDEIVPAEETPPPGKIRDSNTWALGALVRAMGAEPVRFGILPDVEEELLARSRDALDRCDLLIFNGGTSVGERDLVTGVIDRLGEPGVLVHGVDIRPGKPTVFAVCGGKPVFGLPGQPVSALNTFDQFVAPVLRQMLGLPEFVPTVRARLAADVRSADGREDHVRVRLLAGEDGWRAEPILGVSAMITTMVRADGILVIPSGGAGFAAGEEVEVRLLCV